MTNSAQPLRNVTLADLGRSVQIPAHDPASIRPGIAHVGVGGFHRAHQAVYLDDLMAAGLADDWGIIGIGTQPGDMAMCDDLRAQDLRYTLVVKHDAVDYSARVIGSHVGFLHTLLAGRDAVLTQLAAPEIRLVSLTITEGGYCGAEPSCQREGCALELIAAALELRQQQGIEPFTVVSCDNIQGNGDLARRSVARHASSPAVGQWIDEHVCFPNSMVDRITPVTSDDDRRMVAERFGVADCRPVVCEEFTQWVIEDEFGPLGRPPLESAGVQVVADVAPYELIKLRLLNAAHQVLGYLGRLAGHDYVHQAAADPALASMLRRYLLLEGLPSVEAVPGIDLHDYIDTVLARFANPAIADTLARICAYTSDRIPKFLLPVIEHQLVTGGPIDVSVLTLASWARYLGGVDDQGRSHQIEDALAERLVAAAADPDPLAFLGLTEVFGELGAEPRVQQGFVTALASLRERGALATARDYGYPQDRS